MVKADSLHTPPPLRPDLEPVAKHDRRGRTFVRLEDPLRLSDQIVLLPPPLFFVAAQLDGRKTVAEIQTLYYRRFSGRLPDDQLAMLLKTLDEAFLLDNDRFLKKRQAALERYRRLAARPPFFAGSSYAQDPQALKSEIAAQLARAADQERLLREINPMRIVAAAAPHIDPRLGGSVYAGVYRSFSFSPPEVVVLLGVSHHAMRNAYAITDRPFDVPDGRVPVDKEMLRRITDGCTTDFFTDELVHLYEHSIEFQVVYLRHFLQRSFTIVPVLCSFAHPMTHRDRRQFDEFTGALKQALAAEKRSTALIAAVDLSHIGPRYGGDRPPDAALLAQVEEFDRQVLAAAAQRDLQAFDRLFETFPNYNVCGYPALRTLIPLLPPCSAALLCYDNTVMDKSRSTVTFAGMIFYTE